MSRERAAESSLGHADLSSREMLSLGVDGNLSWKIRVRLMGEAVGGDADQAVSLELDAGSVKKTSQQGWRRPRASCTHHQILGTGCGRKEPGVVTWGRRYWGFEGCISVTQLCAQLGSRWPSQVEQLPGPPLLPALGSDPCGITNSASSPAQLPPQILQNAKQTEEQLPWS